jgi:uncharacterized delta-60 repeat protein
LKLDKKLLALIDALIEDALAKIELKEGPQGPRGLKGPAGKDFNFDENEERFTDLILQNLPKTIELTEDQIAMLKGEPGPQGPAGEPGEPGPAGRAGKNGKDFIFEEHEESIRTILQAAKVRFEDLTEDQVEALRGPKGDRGADGKSFSFEEARENINQLLVAYFKEVQDSFKLRFDDLTDEDKSFLRGPRGQRGKPGKDFDLEESLPEISRVVTQHIDSLDLKPKFSDFTDEEKDSLKLKFEHLTDEERFSLRGPRGQRGKMGIQGEVGPQGPEGAVGPMGPRGVPGPMGLQGPQGRDGFHGRDGQDGEDAPRITDIAVDQTNSKEFALSFEFDDGTEIRTKDIQLPKSGNNYYVAMGGGGGEGGGGGTGADGKSAYELAVEDGFVGTLAEWLDSLQGEDGIIGVDGKSAYEIAVENGFVGTEEEWLDSLANGPAGPQGPAGADGADGESAYEIAVANGFVGTESEWLDSLVGPTGPTGPQGPAGADGADGADGSPGTPGADGADGDSAYQVALNNGFVGTEEDWLDSLVGPQGPQGDPGTNGTNGTNGTDGADGDSAYQIALNNGFVGTESEWLDSLVGPQGPAGADGADGADGTVITGAATTIATADLTANRALISNGSGKVAVSSVTSTQLGYLSGVTSSIQTQLDSKSKGVYRFSVNGNLSGVNDSNRKRIDGAVLRSSFNPSVCKLALGKGGRSGSLKIDVRHHQRVNAMVTRIAPEFEAEVNTVTNVAPNHATQSIARAASALSTSSIAYSKSAIQIRSVIVEYGYTRYYLESAPDSEWEVGDYVTISACKNTANNGLFQILGIQTDQWSGSLLLNNTAGVNELNPSGKYDEDRADNYSYANYTYNTNLGTASNTAATSIVDSAKTSDGGRILVGPFTTWNGATANRIVKLLSTGGVDTSFNTNLGTGFPAEASCVHVQADGKILVAGAFTTFKGVARNYLIRLNSDGTEDTTFYTNLGTGFGARVRWVTTDSSSRIYCVGDFVALNGTTRNRIVRLNSDGTVDTTYYTNLGTALNGAAYFCALDNYGQLVVTGDFTAINGTTRNKICRIDTAGNPDLSGFTPTGVGFAATAAQYVWGVAHQADDKIVCVGTFTTYNGSATHSFLVRLNYDGTMDTTFNTNRGAVPSAMCRRVKITGSSQDTYRIHVVGDFTTIGGSTINRYVVLNYDGSINARWTEKVGTGFNDGCYHIDVDGYDFFFGGAFTSFNGWSYNRFMRLSNGIVTSGVALLNMAKFTMSSTIDTTNFAVGENVLTASHTSANNNGQKTVYKVVETGVLHELHLKSSVAFVAQAGAAGTINTNRWKYTTSSAPSGYLVVGEKAKMASHTTPANNGNFTIKEVQALGVVVYNEAGVAQAGVAGTINTNRWTYSVSKECATLYTYSDRVKISNTTAAGNNGIFSPVDYPDSYSFTVYNESGVAQTTRTSATGEAIGETKRVYLDSNCSGLNGYSWVEFNFTEDVTSYDEGSYYAVTSVSSETDFCIKDIEMSRQQGFAGYLNIESKTIFAGSTIEIPATEVSYWDGRSLEVWDLTTSLQSAISGGEIPADRYLGLWVLQDFDDESAEDLTVLVE